MNLLSQSISPEILLKMSLVVTFQLIDLELVLRQPPLQPLILPSNVSQLRLMRLNPILEHVNLHLILHLLSLRVLVHLDLESSVLFRQGGHPGVSLAQQGEDFLELLLHGGVLPVIVDDVGLVLVGGSGQFLSLFHYGSVESVDDFASLPNDFGLSDLGVAQFSRFLLAGLKFGSQGVGF